MLQRHRLFRIAGTVLACLAPTSTQAFPTDMEQCLLEKLKLAKDTATVAELKAMCLKKEFPERTPKDAVAEAEQKTEKTPLETRITMERATSQNPFVITPHKPNYLMPLTYSWHPNTAPFPTNEGELQHLEMKFQLSFKLPLARRLFNDRVSIYFAYTNQSYWQAYNSDFSSPFRETNHEPELFMTYLTDYSLLGFKYRLTTLGISHQSNGRSGEFSRSWNRVYADLVFERGNFAFSLKPWYRIPENEKSSPTDATGDDNPDIEEYMGYGELRIAYKWHQHAFSLMLRNNLRNEDNRGAVELGWSFPLANKLKVYTQYFNGYGESLIDYNAHTSRFGVGIALTDWL